MHSLLRRQLKQLGLSEVVPPTAEEWQSLLGRVSHTYEEADQDRYTLERSVRLSSEEMRRLYDELRESSEVQLAARWTELQNTKDALRLANLDLERRVEERTSALRRAEDQLRHAQKMDAIGRLAGSVAHDFNNMLVVIISCAQLALEQSKQSCGCAEDLEQILGAAQRAASLTQQLLAFSRQQVLEPRVVDLNEVVREMGGLVSRLIGENIRCHVRCSEGPARVLVDPNQIEQVLLNLVVNARDAMPTGGRLEIAVEAVLASPATVQEESLSSADCIALTVRDTGVGMPPDVLARVFEPFFTTKERGKGTGLGLATAYGIIKQSGGSISVRSTEGGGAVFRVLLPRATRSEPARAPSPTPFRAKTGESVLLVEDDEFVRKTAARVLARGGYTVQEASNAEDALAKLAETDVDLLLTDVVMPGMSGADLARTARARFPALAVLVMSGYLDLPANTSLEPGQRLLAKPFTPSTLLGAVRESIDTGPSGVVATPLG